MKTGNFDGQEGFYNWTQCYMSRVPEKAATPASGAVNQAPGVAAFVAAVA